MSQVKERPILFSGPMVQALLNGSKTQTRRVVKPQPDKFIGGLPMKGMMVTHEPGTPDTHWCSEIKCPYGQPGERLWVRETFARVPRTAYACSTGVEQTINPDSDWQAAVYRAGWTRSPESWKPSIHMPRWASRILLEIVSVRVERLNDISAEDAVAEGIQSVFGGWRNYIDGSKHFSLPSYEVCGETMPAPVISYATLWESINGPDSWEANPWVWCVTFKRITP